MARPAGFKIKHWTQAELDLLKDRGLRPKGELLEIAARINRTPKAVWTMAASVCNGVRANERQSIVKERT